jgi:hypothetical protein
MEEPLSQVPAPAHRSLAITGALAAALLATAGYSVHQGRQVKQMAAQNAQVQASLKSTNAALEQITAKLNELSAPKVASQPTPTQVRAHRRASNGTRLAEARWKKLQSQVDEQGNAISATRQDLSSTRTELQGSIARTHGELVILQRKGERNYYEFDLDKAKRFMAEGPIGVRLRKANVKHQYADLELLVDDVSLTKKHVNLYEPAVFYAAESDHPVELVINSVSKNHIHGYVSAPKYRRSELAAMGQSPTTEGNSSDTATNAPPKQREHLAMPK